MECIYRVVVRGRARAPGGRLLRRRAIDALLARSVAHSTAACSTGAASGRAARAVGPGRAVAPGPARCAAPARALRSERVLSQDRAVALPADCAAAPRTPCERSEPRGAAARLRRRPGRLRRSRRADRGIARADALPYTPGLCSEPALTYAHASQRRAALGRWARRVVPYPRASRRALAAAVFPVRPCVRARSARGPGRCAHRPLLHAFRALSYAQSA